VTSSLLEDVSVGVVNSEGKDFIKETIGLSERNNHGSFLFNWMICGRFEELFGA